jgi:hypothetical protein
MFPKNLFMTGGRIMKKVAFVTLIIALVLSTVSFAGLQRKLWWDTPTGTIDEAWAVIDGNTEPNVVDIVGDAASGDQGVDNYVGNFTGYLVAPADGNYVFYVASDDDSQLLLDGVLVASVAGWTGNMEWTNGNVTPSAPIALTAGQLLTVNMAFREGGGGDHFSIGWLTPGSSEPTVVPDAWTIATDEGLGLALGLSPANGTTGVIDAVLSWADPAAGAEPYDVVFGTDPNNLETVASGLTETTYNAGSVPADLAFGTTYTWGVVTAGGTVTSSFTTVQPVVINSVSGDAQPVGVAAQLSVDASSPVGSELSYEWHRLDYEVAPGLVLPDFIVPGGDAAVLSFPEVAAGDEGEYYVIVSSVDGAVSSDAVLLDVQTGMIHRYSFGDSDGTVVPDSVGGADATLVNNTGLASVTDGQVVLGNDGSQSSNGNDGDANGDYVDLPEGLVSSLTQMTLQIWTTWNDDTQGWARVYDFGTSNQGNGLSGSADGAGIKSFYFTPKTGYNENSIVEYRNGGNAPNIQPGGKLPLGQEVMLTQIHDDKANTVKLYINGMAVGGFAPIFPLSDLDDNNNWLGRSQWGDVLYVGSYNEMRIYDTALSAEEIAADYLAGPDAIGQLPDPSGGPALLGDLNGDGVYDLLDIAIAADQFLTERLDRDAQIAELQE